jgi:hypothetical protein
MKALHSYSVGVLLATCLAAGWTAVPVEAQAVPNTGADVLIANHPNQDNANVKLAALAKRKPGDPNPYVIGNDSVKRYVTMVGECAKAGLLRLK